MRNTSRFQQFIKTKNLVKRLHKAADAGWLEWLHPRKNNGEFTSGGAGSETAESGNSSTPLRAAKAQNKPGTRVSAFPVLNLPGDKIAALKEESYQRAVKGKGPKPVEKEVSISSLASVQEIVETNKVKAIAKKYKSEKELSGIHDKPRVFKYGSKYVLVDGNHRASAALMNGHSKLTVSYLGDFTNLD
jgi:hypothetical protein